MFSPIPLSTMPAISDPYREEAYTKTLQAAFLENGFVNLPGFLSDSAYDLVVRNLDGIHQRRVRRDFIMPGYQTERKMSVVGGANLARQCLPLVALYSNSELRSLLSRIVGHQIVSVRHNQEFMVANFLDGPSDTHGWHTDDPQYALIVITEGPGEDEGGELEYIPNWLKFCADFGVSQSSGSEEGVTLAHTLGRVRSAKLRSGDCYFLNAREALHRVAPTRGNGRRKALNMAFDSRVYRNFGDTAQILYGT